MTIIKIGIIVLAGIAFLYAVTRSELPECDCEDCDLCPFPRCEDAPKDLSKVKLRKMHGKIVMIVTKDSVFPVRIDVRDDDIYVVNQFGSSTTVDDVRKNGGKFYEKSEIEA